MERENNAGGGADSGAAVPRVSAFDHMLRHLVAEYGTVPAVLLPSLVIAAAAAILAFAWEYDHLGAEQLGGLAAAVGGCVFAAALALSYPAARTIRRLLHQEAEAAKSVEELDKTRARLEVSEQRFRHIAEAASDWFWEMGPDLRFSYFSDRAEEIVGVPRDFHIGKTRAELAGEDLRTEKWQRHLADLENHRPFKDFRFVRQGHDGRLQYLSTSGKPLFDDGGKFLGYIGVGSDLTPHVEAQEQVQLANERLAVAIEFLSELFFLWGPDDRLIMCNAQARRMNASIPDFIKPGVSYEEHICAAVAENLIPEAVGQEQAWCAERIAKHKNPDGPFELRRQEDKWLLVNEQKLDDGTIITLATDISEVKRHEEELAQSEQRLQDFADTAADWFWEQDKDLRFTYMSLANEGISGMTANAHYGKTRRETNPMGVSEEQMRQHEELLATHQPFEDFRFFRIRPDGVKVFLSTSGRPVFDEKGEFTGYRGVGRDITELVAAEERVRAERDRAEAANRAKSDFLARMSHELRTPLNAILGFSQVIRDETFGAVGHEQYRDYAGDIHRSGQHLLSLINDLLDLSKIEAGKLVLEEELLDVGAIVDDMLRLFKGTAEDAGLALEARVAPGLPGLLADSRAVRQMITNLVSNAVKFTASGGRVTVSAEREDAGLVIHIADTGSGFEPGDLELVLQPFGRVDQPTVRTVDGTGLGLPIVKSLIESHGGLLHLVSEPGEGTDAMLRFPPERLVEREDARLGAG